MDKELSASDWLRKNRNEGCPLHGFHIPDSLVRYSGYCRHCNQFWRFRRWIEHKNIPYWWHYFNPETKEVVGKVFHGSKRGKRAYSKNKA